MIIAVNFPKKIFQKKKIYCDDHSSLSSTTAVHKYTSHPFGNFLHSFRGELISCARLVSRCCIFYNRKRRNCTRNSHTNPPVVTGRMGLQRFEKFPKGIERCERRRNQWQKSSPSVGTEHEEINTAGQTKSSDLVWFLAKLSGRVTFDRRKGPSPGFFFLMKNKNSSQIG